MLFIILSTLRLTGSVPLSVGSYEMQCELCGGEVLGHILETSPTPSASPSPFPNDDISSCSVLERDDLVLVRAASCETASPKRASVAEASSSTASVSAASPTTRTSSSNIRIDVSEVKDGISSVQITVNNAGSKPTQLDQSEIKKMKEFLLTNLESS